MENIVLFIPITAYILDAVFEEPSVKFHPVCWLGNTASFLEQKKLPSLQNHTLRFLYGIFCTTLLMLIFCILPLLIFCIFKKYCLYYADTLYPFMAFTIASFILYLCIAPKSLTLHIKAIQKELQKNNIAEAQKKLSYIVGRNTNTMNEHDIIRASIESLAENSLDSTLASFFWFSLGYCFFSYEGAIFFPLLHRIINTLDAMWGKKNEQYFYFGKFPARFDDVLNYLPARLCFYTILLACFCIKECNSKNAYVIGKKYRSKHASPNSAWAEAPYAGALNLKLAGPVSYGDFFCDYPYLGEGSLEAAQKHLAAALKIFHVSIFICLIFCTVFLFFT